MNLRVGIGDPSVDIHHDVRGSFGALLREAIMGRPAYAALGPIYANDPAHDLISPFARTALETRWRIDDESLLMPDDQLERVRGVRAAAVVKRLWAGDLDVTDVSDWTRAGLVLEVARRNGIHVGGRGVLHPNWIMNGTVTGRFGCEPVRGPNWTFSPLSMGPDDRARVRPSDAVRQIAVLDFKAMDVVSMTAIVPELAEAIGDHPDPYQRIAELTTKWWPREQAKLSFLTWAYGGSVDPAIAPFLEHAFPKISAIRSGLEHGEFPRLVQRTSAAAFRAALSRTLPLLTTPWIIPMFTVHDELTLDCSEVGLDRLGEVTKAMETGASERTGRPYRVSVRTGYTYEEAKNR